MGNIKKVIHVSETEIDLRTGMGRVAFHWKSAFERQNIEFHHFGPERVGACLHKALWHRAALQSVIKSDLKPDIVIAHEPVSYAFKKSGFPTVVVSHTPERRLAEILKPITPPAPTFLAQTRRLVLAKFLWRWRQRQCDLGLRHANLVLVSNRSDARYVNSFYGRQSEDIFVFRNGIDPVQPQSIAGSSADSALFYASWVPRKGVATLIDSLMLLRAANVAMKLVACTGMSLGTTPPGWPKELKDLIELVPRIHQAEESALFQRAKIFVLPSWVEGQPLALLQAMAHGRCCIVSDIPGHSDLIEHGRNGLKFKPGDAVDLAHLLGTCRRSEELCNRLGAAAAESVADRSWARVSDELTHRLLGKNF